VVITSYKKGTLGSFLLVVGNLTCVKKARVCWHRLIKFVTENLSWQSHLPLWASRYVSKILQNYWVELNEMNFHCIYILMISFNPFPWFYYLKDKVHVLSCSILNLLAPFFLNWSFEIIFCFIYSLSKLPLFKKPM